MTENRLKRRLGVFLVSSHLGTLFVAIFAKLIGGLSADEFTTVLAVIAPMFAGYTSAVVAYFVEHRHITADSSRKITSTFAWLSLVLPAVLAVLIILSIILKSLNLGFVDFEDMKRFLIAMESLLAAYIGTIVFTLFPRSTDESKGRDALRGDRP